MKNASITIMAFISFLRETREWVSPISTESQFLSHGVLTPEEFIKSGDRLVAISPLWSWSAATRSNLSRPHLPSDKQYLIARNVTSNTRVQSMEANYMEEVDGDYCLSNFSQELSSIRDEGDINVIVVSNHEDEESDEKAKSASGIGNDNISGQPGSRRFYTVLISYDKYYRTPRVFFTGFDDTGGTALEPECLFEDVFVENARKTVTLERFPHTGQHMCSIHPCNHGNSMRKVIEQCIAHDLSPSVEQYLFIFLKLFSSIIPCIDFDFQEVVVI